jgi:hypothetical protein
MLLLSINNTQAGRHDSSSIYTQQQRVAAGVVPGMAGRGDRLSLALARETRVQRVVISYEPHPLTFCARTNVSSHLVPITIRHWSA